MNRSFFGDYTRRDFLNVSLASALGVSSAGWMSALAAGEKKARGRACILLWMTGGPSQLDTFDLKPGHKNGGPYKPIATSVPGIKISEHFPKIAPFMNDAAIVRSLHS